MQPIHENEEAIDGGMTRRRLLIAVDDSSESERALSWTVEELYRFGDKLAILTVPKM